MRKLLQSVLVVGALLAGSAAQAAWSNLSFEEGLTGWCSGTGCNGAASQLSYQAGVSVPDGDKVAKLSFNASTAGNVILQMSGAALPAGTLLDYRFKTADTSGGDWFRIQYVLNGTTHDLFSGNGKLDSGGQPLDSLWKSFSLAGVTSLTFTYHQDNDARQSWAFLDITPAVPEPGEWAMMLAGLGMVGAMARRRGNKR